MRALILLYTLLIPSFACSFCFEEAGKLYDISPVLLKSIAKAESGFNPSASHRNTNGTQDIGLMQINSAWVSTLGLTSGELLADACLNVRAGAYILKDCISRYGYTWQAVGCYNASSPGKRSRYAWRIFEILKAANKNTETTASAVAPAKEARVPETRSKQSYLSFSVNEESVSPTDTKGTP
jgi:soluble lytic murein transglycosylase-like protein